MAAVTCGPYRSEVKDRFVFRTQRLVICGANTAVTSSDAIAADSLQISASFFLKRVAPWELEHE